MGGARSCTVDTVGDGGPDGVGGRHENIALVKSVVEPVEKAVQDTQDRLEEVAGFGLRVSEHEGMVKPLEKAMQGTQDLLEEMVANRLGTRVRELESMMKPLKPLEKAVQDTRDRLEMMAVDKKTGDDELARLNGLADDIEDSRSASTSLRRRSARWSTRWRAAWTPWPPAAGPRARRAKANAEMPRAQGARTRPPPAQGSVLLHLRPSVIVV